MRLNGWAWVYLATFLVDVVLLIVHLSWERLPIDLAFLLVGAFVTACLVGLEVNSAARADARRGLVEQR